MQSRSGAWHEHTQTSVHRLLLAMVHYQILIL
jgi:hypothetical protein